MVNLQAMLDEYLEMKDGAIRCIPEGLSDSMANATDLLADETAVLHFWMLKSSVEANHGSKIGPEEFSGLFEKYVWDSDEEILSPWPTFVSYCSVDTELLTFEGAHTRHFLEHALVFLRKLGIADGAYSEAIDSYIQYFLIAYICYSEACTE